MFAKKNKNKGFTMIEAVVAVSILSVLIALIVPTYTAVVQNTRQQLDDAKLGSVCDAFKSSMTDPGVQMEIAKLADGESVMVIFQTNKDGLIVFSKGEVRGHSSYAELKTTLLWQYASQYIDDRYDAASNKLENKYIVFTITPKTASSTTKCEYQILKDLDDVEF